MCGACCGPASDCMLAQAPQLKLLIVQSSQCNNHCYQSHQLNAPTRHRWYEREGPLRGTGAPVVAVLLYRKHVITDQQYIPQLIRQMEGEGLIPLPIFINGVEAHTVVRDQLSSRHEQELIRRGEAGSSSSLKRDAVVVDAVVNTIGFPLVGGPAGETPLQAAHSRCFGVASDLGTGNLLHLMLTTCLACMQMHAHPCACSNRPCGLTTPALY